MTDARKRRNAARAAARRFLKTREAVAEKIKRDTNRNRKRGVAMSDNPAELTDAEKLTALDMYLKALKPHADILRARITKDLKERKVEKVGAYLDLGDPEPTQIGSVTYRKGAKSARITDEAAAIRWCIKNHPEHIMQAIRPAYLQVLLEAAKTMDVGGHGYDPATGEELDWIDVVQGEPGVTVTTTPAGKARMAALAGGFAGMLEAPPAQVEPKMPDNDPYGPGTTYPNEVTL